MTDPRVPKELNAIVDVVLAYKPKPKSKPGKKRKNLAAKIAKDAALSSSDAPKRNQTAR